MTSEDVGERDLKTLLANLNPRLHEGEYAICLLDEERASALNRQLLASFREREGLTAVLPLAEARAHRIPFHAPLRMITLTIHSSLEAVGLLSAVTATLASAGIPVNVFSAYFHDHLLISSDRAEEALERLRQLQRDSA